MTDHPTNLIGLAGVLLVVLGPIITTIISSRRIAKSSALRSKAIGDSVSEVKDQIVNGHSDTSNLREDIDRVVRTGDQTHSLLLDTHRILTDHHGHILRLGDKIEAHDKMIQSLTSQFDDLSGIVERRNLK